MASPIPRPAEVVNGYEFNKACRIKQTAQQNGPAFLVDPGDLRKQRKD